MGTVARLFVQGGTLTFNAEVPYDRQLLFEQADQYAKRQGSIQLDLDGVQWTVRASMRRSPRCTTCGSRVSSLSYSDHRRLLCARCAHALTPLAAQALRARPRPPGTASQGGSPRTGRTKR